MSASALAFCLIVTTAVDSTLCHDWRNSAQRLAVADQSKPRRIRHEEPVRAVSLAAKANSTKPQAFELGTLVPNRNGRSLQLCQFLGACPRAVNGVYCDGCEGCGEATWNASRPIPWEVFAQGEYVGNFRTPHVDEYRLRPNDLIQFIYRLTRVQSSHPYELQVGDLIRVESLADPELAPENLLIQPDGTITLRHLNQVMAARRTVEDLRRDLEKQYEKFFKIPGITVTPVVVNSKLEDLRAAVDSRYGRGGQSREATVTPSGTVQLTAIGSVPAQGLTLNELGQEIDARYAEVVDGVEVTPVLLRRAPRHVYVLGEVNQPGRFSLVGPTTVMQALALAGGHINGANLRQVVVFRRTDDWRLMATKLDLRGGVYGKKPCPADEIWIRDSDIVIVPKEPLKVANELIELVFTNGLYGVLPFFGSEGGGFINLSTL